MKKKKKNQEQTKCLTKLQGRTNYPRLLAVVISDPVTARASLPFGSVPCWEFERWGHAWAPEYLHKVAAVGRGT